MKKNLALGMALLLLLNMSACASKTIENPLSSIEDDYKSGCSNIEGTTEIDEETFETIANQFSQNITDFSSYLQTHQAEIASGSKISEFDDYASAFSDIFDFDYQVIYYDGTVAEDYQPAWEKFQQAVADFQESINSCYDQESDAALNTFNTMVSNMAGEIEEYTALLPHLPADIPIRDGHSA